MAEKKPIFFSIISLHSKYLYMHTNYSLSLLSSIAWIFITKGKCGKIIGFARLALEKPSYSEVLPLPHSKYEATDYLQAGYLILLRGIKELTPSSY